MAVRMIDHNSDEYRQMVELRLQILRKPLGLSFSNEELEKEKDDILIGCFEDDKIEGCCILTDLGNDKTAVKLRQMAVTAGLQGKGIGRVLMTFAENVARDLGYKKLIMHARKTALGFYEKLGYNVCSGEFEEVSIPHYAMEKKL
jgi:predicted GNAT family N-acyltransferase